VYRATLKVAKMDLATATSHVQQFQDISQASESALATLNATYDEYKASTEAQIARLEVRDIMQGCRAYQFMWSLVGSESS
jgi:hypothetical protein